MGVESLPDEIVPDLDPRKRVKLVNFILSESPKFKILGITAVDLTDIRNLDIASSTRANNLRGMRKYNVGPFSLGYTHNFGTMSETTAYRNHINNS